MFQIIKGVSHCDHVSAETLAFVQQTFKDRAGFFIQTVEMPVDLPELDNGIYGPISGDAPISESEVYYANRAGRDWSSRLIDKPMRKTRMLTVIAGPHDGNDCVLYTCYGGPAAEREPNDPNCPASDLEKCKEFWSQHALAQSK